MQAVLGQSRSESLVDQLHKDIKYDFRLLLKVEGLV